MTIDVNQQVQRVDVRTVLPPPVDVHVQRIDVDVAQAVQRIGVSAQRIVVDVSQIGRPGRDGQSVGGTFTATAGETIHGRRIVRIAGGLIHHPRLTVPAHADQCIGLALQSGNTGADLLVRTGGQHSDAAWSWAPGPIYCADNGVLTQAVIAVGWVLKVGIAVNPTTIEVDIDNAFIRS